MKYIIANWKMNMSLSNVDNWLSDFELLIEKKDIKNQVILAGTFPYLYKIADFAKKYNFIHAAAQDVSKNEKGAFTGDAGAFQIKDFAEYCIVGHSERKEPRDLVFQKRENCLEQGIAPVVCFTDPSSIMENVFEGTLSAWEDPNNISKDGVYRDKATSDVDDSFKLMRILAPEAVILYGGSVNRNNVAEIAAIENVDGVLVGNASLDPEHFYEIVKAFSDL